MVGFELHPDAEHLSPVLNYELKISNPKFKISPISENSTWSDSSCWSFSALFSTIWREQSLNSEFVVFHGKVHLLFPPITLAVQSTRQVVETIGCGLVFQAWKTSGKITSSRPAMSSALFSVCIWWGKDPVVISM